MAERIDGIETREQMLEAACALFGEHGFERVTVKMICQASGANVSAVSYHFGSKMGLYEAAWAEAYRRVNERYPVDGGLPAGAEPTERLRAVVGALLNRMLNHSVLGYAGQLLMREMSGTGLIKKAVRRKTIDPVREQVREVIRANVGADVDQERVNWLEFSVVSQCLVFGKRGGQMPPAFAGRAVDEQFIEELRDHIVAFSLEGMRGFANQKTGIKNGSKKRMVNA